MSGTDKILASLSADCEAECSAIYNSAREKADLILKNAETQAQTRAQEIIADSEKKAQEIIRLAESGAEMKKRQSALSKKVKLLNSALSDALNELEKMENAEYFSVIKRLAVKNALNGSGVLLMSEADANNMPADFIDSLNNELSGKSSLHMEISPRLNKKGVILVYGDIEINLTFEAIISSQEDSLKETACKILFS